MYTANILRIFCIHNSNACQSDMLVISRVKKAYICLIKGLNTIREKHAMNNCLSKFMVLQVNNWLDNIQSSCVVDLNSFLSTWCDVVLFPVTAPRNQMPQTTVISTVSSCCYISSTQIVILWTHKVIEHAACSVNMKHKVTIRELCHCKSRTTCYDVLSGKLPTRRGILRIIFIVLLNNLISGKLFEDHINLVIGCLKKAYITNYLAKM